MLVITEILKKQISDQVSSNEPHGNRFMFFFDLHNFTPIHFNSFLQEDYFKNNLKRLYTRREGRVMARNWSQFLMSVEYGRVGRSHLTRVSVLEKLCRGQHGVARLSKVPLVVLEEAVERVVERSMSIEKEGRRGRVDHGLGAEQRWSYHVLADAVPLVENLTRNKRPSETVR